jgi:endonuclease-8
MGSRRALRRLTADPARSISEALLDQRVIAGIGNVFPVRALLPARHPSG